METNEQVVYLKCLKAGDVGPVTGWHWPEVGEWTPCVARPEWARRGYHLCVRGGVMQWLEDCNVYVTEARGPISKSGDGKHYIVAVQQARLLRRLPWSDAEKSRLIAFCLRQFLGIGMFSNPKPIVDAIDAWQDTPYFSWTGSQFRQRCIDKLDQERRRTRTTAAQDALDVIRTVMQYRQISLAEVSKSVCAAICRHTAKYCGDQVLDAQYGEFCRLTGLK